MNMPGGPEIVVIILVALIVLGPQQLPKAMRTFGSVMGEIRKVSNGFQNEMRNAMNTLTDEVDAKQPASTPPVAAPSEVAVPVVDEVVASNLEGAADPGPIEAAAVADAPAAASAEETTAAPAPEAPRATGSAADRAAG